VKIFFEYNIINSFAKTSKLKNKLLYFFLFLWALTANSQTIFYDQLDLKSGLPSSVVYDIFQDSKGFIWIATDEGLIKYNGYDFKSYSHHDLHSKAGSNIKEDDLGRIWYQTFDGFLFFIDNKEKPINSLVPISY
jgi:ligand-binding sensor domain-containing protein